MMQQLIENFTDQLRDGLEAGGKMHVLPASRDIRNVVVAGLGGSGMAAELVQAVVSGEMKVPMTIIKSYDLPAFVDAHTLFIASSFSGNTEETLAVMEQVAQRNATTVCLTAGGKLAGMARANNFTLVPIPGGISVPKAFAMYNFIQLLFILKNYGLVSDQFIGQLHAAIELIEEREDFIREGAQSMAAGLKGKLPVLYGDAKFMPVLLRFQQQLNENAKQLAHVNVFPEMNHNELTGWVHPEPVLLNTMVVLLTTEFDHPRVKLRIDLCRPLIGRRSGGTTEVFLRFGKSFLEQCVYAVHLFDWTSFYLAQENNADTLEGETVAYLKDGLAKV